MCNSGFKTTIRCADGGSSTHFPYVRPGETREHTVGAFGPCFVHGSDRYGDFVELKIDATQARIFSPRPYHSTGSSAC